MSKNPRMTKQDIALAAGAIRRAFSRSELRRLVIESGAIPSHSDPSRPRVKNWVRCEKCKKPEARSLVQVDHRFDQVIPLDTALADVVCSEGGWDNLVNRIWCDPRNLQNLCISCHKIKTLEENRVRRRNRKEKNVKRS